jgi:predicted RNase H-like HicB family nuclease
MFYLSLIYRDSEGGWGFTIPDIPGFTAHSENPSLGEALAEAREVLTMHLTAMADNGLDLPRARDPGEVMDDPEVQEDLASAEATILIPATIAGGRTLRVNLSLDEWTLGMIDSAARDRSLTRSGFVAEACRRYAAGEMTGAERHAGSRGSAHPMLRAPGHAAGPGL